MRPEHFWVTIIAILPILLSCIGSSHAQLTKDISGPTYQESKVDRKRNDTENILLFNNDTTRMYSHQMLFGDIMANSMNKFVPFSNVNENCTRDGQNFMESLNNQTLWAVQSK